MVIFPIPKPFISKHKVQLSLEDLTLIFNDLFSSKYNIRLEGGANEPIYLPTSSDCKTNRLIFRSNYISSALHEVAHWCLAGDKRRKMIDYGYWYNKDGRSNIEQKIFEEVEIKPQALEWIFSIASNNTFNISVDNLDDDTEPSYYFLKSISDQAHSWCIESLPNRALLFVNALVCYTGINPFDSSLYQFFSE